MGKSPEELRAYIEGDDPITGRPVMTEIIEALTKPLTEEETRRYTFDRSTPRFVEPASEEAMRELFWEQRWTDGLPIVLPTPERVEAMLAHTMHDPNEIVGRMRPTGTREAWWFTVEKVAVNAVMAGCKPEYFPVVLALAATENTARPSTTSSAAAMCMVNGPVRHEIGMNWGTGALGPFNHANSTIGRAYGLLSQNLQGGSVPGHTYLGSMGNNYGYNSLCFAEHEERSPWEPFHVRHGFDAMESTVSVWGGNRATAFILGLRETHWREHVQYLLRGLNPHTPPTFMLDPITADQFVVRGGFDTVEKLSDWIYETATMPHKHYWDYQLIQNYVLPRALKGEEPSASRWEDHGPDDLVPMFNREDIHVVVVGGETNGYWRIMGNNYRKTVSVDNWR